MTSEIFDVWYRLVKLWRLNFQHAFFQSSSTRRPLTRAMSNCPPHSSLSLLASKESWRFTIFGKFSFSVPNFETVSRVGLWPLPFIRLERLNSCWPLKSRCLSFLSLGFWKTGPEVNLWRFLFLSPGGRRLLYVTCSTGGAAVSYCRGTVWESFRRCCKSPGVEVADRWCKTRWDR